jgi:HlyD family secretion protein
MPFSKRSVIKYGAISLAVVVCVILYLLFVRWRPVEVRAARVRRGEIRSFVEEEGKAVLRRTQIVSTTVPGILGPVILEEGDRVEKGQDVAEIEDTEVLGKVREAEAGIREVRAQISGLETKSPKPAELRRAKEAIDQAESRLRAARVEREILAGKQNLARNDLKRFTKLFQDGLVSDREMDGVRQKAKETEEVLSRQDSLIKVFEQGVAIARASSDVLEDARDDTAYLEKVYSAQLDRIEEELKVLRDRLRRTKITSPFEGVILVRFTRGSTFVLAGTPVVEVGDPASLEIRADVLTDEVRDVRPGLAVEIFGEYLGGRVVRGRVDRILPRAFTKISALGIEQQRVGVMITFDRGEAKLKPAYEVDVRIITRKKEKVLIIPQKALFDLDGRSQVFAVNGKRAVLRPVQTGLENEEVVEVLSGLSEGEWILVDPGVHITPGCRVAPLLREAQKGH